ncbi:hypothetical protein QTO34_002591 [Cnephaeus nilssonii]|uniref:Ig-like domain-containing protein n=1 Tax=Cnephaeus nilssonii TaxID=3371016 RepID=A0AA40HSM7_CNENI|nr:hypothetical protein QTO34_002591 [Eptesicus nilssonii]
MLLLQIPLLAVLLVAGDNEDVFQEEISFKMIQSSSFYNNSWVKIQNSAWLDDLQTHGWDNSGKIIFLRPWSKGNLSEEELKELEEFFHGFSIIMPQVIHRHANQWQLKLKPEAWLSTGPNPSLDRQMLVCHVSGFHPKPIWVKWMRGEQVQQGKQQSGILPNADGTWYLQVFLEVEATETSGLYCRVRHSSLGGQDIILYLERHRSSRGWIIVAVMVPLVLLTALAFGLRKRWSHCEPPANVLPLE